jgi:DNA repair protein RadC
MMIKEMRSEDKPRERFAKAPDTASMVDLVAILLRTGRHGCSVMDMAQEVVEQIRLSTDVNGFDNLDWRDLISVKGVGQDKAITVCAAVELGRRLAQFHNKKQLENFSFPEAVASYFMEKLRHEPYFINLIRIPFRLRGIFLFIFPICHNMRSFNYNS